MTDIAVVDTTGAGDIFGGTAMYGILQNGGLPEALEEAVMKKIARFACAAASLSTTELGGISSVKEINEVKAYMENERSAVKIGP